MKNVVAIMLSLLLSLLPLGVGASAFAEAGIEIGIETGTETVTEAVTEAPTELSADAVVEATVEGFSGPIPIYTVAEFDAIRHQPGGHFVLQEDIDLSDISDWQPIPYFSGTLDGQGFSVAGLSINRPLANSVGLFGVVNGGTIRNLTVALSGDIRGNGAVGVVAGRTSHLNSGGAAFYNITVLGHGHRVQGQLLLGHIGGLVGYAGDNTLLEGNIVENIRVEGTGLSGYIGGLVGAARNARVINNKVRSSHVEGGSNVGGLIGVAYGTSRLTFADGTQVAGGYVCANTTVVGRLSNTGGAFGSLLGNARAQHVISHAMVESQGHHVGGFAGVVLNNAQVTASAAYGDASGPRYIGGFAGVISNHAQVANAYSRGDVRSTGGIVGGVVGGFVGSFSLFARIENTYATGAVSGSSRLGGFAGENIGFTQRYAGHNFFNLDTAGTNNPHGTGLGTTHGGALSSANRPQGRTTAQLQGQDNFTGWDFTNVWHIAEGDSFPYFVPFLW